MSDVPGIVSSYAHTFCSRHHIIGVSGIIGAGKSRFTKALAKLRGYDAYFEPVEENPYLAKFYEDKAKYGTIMQIYLLNERFNQHQQMIWSKNHAIQDRTIYEDVIFAKMLRESGDIEEPNRQAGLFVHRSSLILRCYARVPR